MREHHEIPEKRKSGKTGTNGGLSLFGFSGIPTVPIISTIPTIRVLLPPTPPKSAGTPLAANRAPLPRPAFQYLDDEENAT